MLSLFASVLSLASIIIILVVYENRQLDEWTAKVSINAMISALSAVFKGSLAMPVTEGISQLKWLMSAQQPQALSQLEVYDKASRGDWGSAMLIFGQFRSESKAYLASFGAALVIIVLATDPFAQATMSLYSCTRNGTGVASIPRANRYNVMIDTHERLWVGGDFKTGMQLASYRGLVKPPANSSASISVSCATGNYTFPADGGATFTSLAMCSQAWDVTDRVQVEESNDGFIYTLGSDNGLSGGSTLNMSSISAPDTSFKDSDKNPWNRTSVLDVYIMSMLRDNSTDCKPPLCSTIRRYNANFRPSAFVFSLLPCVKTFNAEVRHGRYVETVISEEYLHYMPQLNGVKYQLPMNRTRINGKWQQCTSTAAPNEVNTIGVYSGPSRAATTSQYHYSPECVFEFFGGAYLAANLASTLFSPVVLRAETPWETRLWGNGSTDDAVASFADGLALAISAQMRTDATDPDELREVRGTTKVEKTCIRIHWGYVAFFAAILTSEVLFLATIMVIGTRSRLRTDWKSSALAVAFLSAGALQKDGWRVANPESEGSLREAARSIKASLCDDSEHWRLQTQETS